MNLTTEIEEVKVDISLVRQDFQILRERVTEAEVRLSSVEDSLSPPPSRIPQTPCSCKYISSCRNRMTLRIDSTDVISDSLVCQRGWRGRTPLHFWKSCCATREGGCLPHICCRACTSHDRQISTGCSTPPYLHREVSQLQG